MAILETLLWLGLGCLALFKVGSWLSSKYDWRKSLKPGDDKKTLLEEWSALIGWTGFWVMATIILFWKMPGVMGYFISTVGYLPAVLVITLFLISTWMASYEKDAAKKSRTRLAKTAKMIGIGLLILCLGADISGLSEVSAEGFGRKVSNTKWLGPASKEKPEDGARIGVIPVDATELMTCTIEVPPAPAWSKTIGEAFGTADGGLQVDHGGTLVVLTKRQLKDRTFITSPASPVICSQNGKTWPDAPHKPGGPIVKTENLTGNFRSEDTVHRKFQSTNGQPTTVVVQIFRQTFRS